MHVFAILCPLAAYPSIRATPQQKADIRLGRLDNTAAEASRLCI
jgi:hypothetical protein